MNQDRIKQPLLSFIKSAFSRIDYYAYYKCKVVSQSSDGLKVDLVPEDQRIPTLSNIPLRLGIPQAVAKFAPGAHVMLGWENADPSKPYALAGFSNDATLTMLEIGGSSAQFVALANLVKSELGSIATALSSHTHSGVTAGAGMTGPSSSTYSAGDVAAQKVKVA